MSCTRRVDRVSVGDVRRGLRLYGENRSALARKLNVSRRTIVRMIKLMKTIALSVLLLACAPSPEPTSDKEPAQDGSGGGASSSSSDGGGGTPDPPPPPITGEACYMAISGICSFTPEMSVRFGDLFCDERSDNWVTLPSCPAENLIGCCGDDTMWTCYYPGSPDAEPYCDNWLENLP